MKIAGWLMVLLFVASCSTLSDQPAAPLVASGKISPTTICRGELLNVSGDGFKSGTIQVLLFPPETRDQVEQQGKIQRDIKESVTLGASPVGFDGHFEFSTKIEDEIGTNGKGEKVTLKPGASYVIGISSPELPTGYIGAGSFSACNK